MAISTVDTKSFRDFNPSSVRSGESTLVPVDDGMPVVAVDLQAEIADAMEEMADLVSVFGRSAGKSGKKNVEENDFLSSILEELADENLESLVSQMVKSKMSAAELLRQGRGMFPDDCDLMQALRELLYRRKLSALQKRELQKAIADLEKFTDTQKTQSGVNVARVAKKFTQGQEALTAKALRSAYLNFLELDIPASYLYQDWVTQFGCQHRQRILAFMLSALLCDMKSVSPGINDMEFGQLSGKLFLTRGLNSIDSLLIEKMAAFPFLMQPSNNQEEELISLFMTGLLEYEQFPQQLSSFVKRFMFKVLIKHRVTFVQMFLDVFSRTSEFFYANNEDRLRLIEMIRDMMHSLYKKERRLGIWNDYYS
ncbi:HrpJ domain-containing protein [Enterobacter sp. 22466]|uniref:HrpJ domain-containing protein n=1 Tax=Enterobacter sp. 22466 TaxID=3453924 RepID=UPI003F83804E